jgi:hypothetical protein
MKKFLLFFTLLISLGLFSACSRSEDVQSQSASPISQDMQSPDVAITPQISSIVDSRDAMPSLNTDTISCPQDVQECPDGTFVAREAPSCEFTECPKEKINVMKPLPEGDFREIVSAGDFIGTFYANGYTKIVKERDLYCLEVNEGNEENCPEYSLFYFILKDYSSQNVVKSFLEKYGALDKNSILLGCLNEEEEVSYSFTYFPNEEPTDGTTLIEGEGKFSSSETKKLISSNSDNLVTLKITKKGFIAGMSSSSCDTYFSSIELL